MTIVPRLTIALSLLTLFATAAPKARSETLRDEGRPQRLFGLVIGNNWSNGTDVPLRYADDDAVQNADLLLQLGANVILLTEMDQETKALHPHLEAVTPTRNALIAANRTLNKLMRQSREKGEKPVLYLFFSGHGDVEHNEGYIHLKGSRLRRTELIEILKSSAAVSNHVIIDACNSFFMVFDRGPGGKRRPVRGILEEKDSELPANTGVMLSTSASGDSHEWEAFQGGVFSHELRSALRGAADVDLDGVVSYTEAAAFIWTANSGIPNRRYRPAFFSRAPADSKLAEDGLIDLGNSGGDVLHLGPKVSQHYYLEDAQGLRVADFHPGAEQALVILLPTRRPLFLRETDSDVEFVLPRGKSLYLDELEAKRQSVAVRGAEHLAFKKIFSLKFSKKSIADYINRPQELFAEMSSLPPLTWTRRSFGISAAVLAVTGGVFTGFALEQRNAISSHSTGSERHDANLRISQFNTAAIICYTVAGAALATYLIWTLWPKKTVDVSRAPYYIDGLNFGVQF